MRGEELKAVTQQARLRGCTNVILSGVGSSYTAALAAKPAFDELVNLPTHLWPATELCLHFSSLGPDALVAILSRSGERRYVFEAVQLAQRSGAMTIALTAAPKSLMATESSQVILTSEGPESSFPKTKSVTAGVGVFLELALALSTAEDGIAHMYSSLDRVPQLIDQVLVMAEQSLCKLAETFLSFEQVVVVGTGANAAVAMEMQIKLQESALVPTQCMDTGNLFHGPLCLLDRRWLVILLITEDDLALSSETLGLVKAMGGNTLAVYPEGLRIDPKPDYSVRLPLSPHRLLDALIYLPALQLLVYHWTLAKGLDPDSPPGNEVLLKAFVPDGRRETDQPLSCQ